jgi:hypothetical protein
MAVMRASVLAAVIAIGGALPLAGCEWLYPSEVASGDGGAGEASFGSSSGSTSSGGSSSGSGEGRVDGSSTEADGSLGSDQDGSGNNTVDAGAADDASGAGDGGVTPIAFVQVASRDSKNSVTTVSATYSSPQRAGDLNVVVVGWSNPSHGVASISDSAGNSYALAAGPASTSGVALAVYFARGIAGSTSNTLTVDFDSDDFPCLAILEYSGVSQVDQSAPGTGSGDMASTATVTTSTPRELVFGAGEPDQNASANFANAGSGFTKRVITSVSGMTAEDMVVSQVGSYAASGTLDSSSGWVMQVVTFK